MPRRQLETRYIDGYFGLGDIADARGFLYGLPIGTLDSETHYFWNASDACCDFHQTRVDDLAYLSAVLDDIERRYSVDPKRVYFVGHSNGGFLSHRLSCDLSPRIAGIGCINSAVELWTIQGGRTHPDPPADVAHAHLRLPRRPPGARSSSSSTFDRLRPRSGVVTIGLHLRREEPMSNLTVVKTDQAPAAIGPYSQGVIAPAARLLFCSGQIPLDPKSGEMVGAGDVRAQTRRVMDNLAGVLAAGGASFSSVVKTTIYLADLQDFGAVNEIYGGHFKVNPPARATVQAAGLPRGALVEIDAIALVG